MKSLEEVEQYFPGFIAFVDCSEQQIPRPKDKIRKRIYYSGKKKKHTVKNLYTANQNGLIIYKTKHRQRQVESMITMSIKRIILNYQRM